MHPMKRALAGPTIVALLLVLVATAVPRSARAVPLDNRPKILLHLKPVTTKNQCTSYGRLTDCALAETRGQVGVSGAGPFYYMYVLVATGAYRAEALGGNDLGLAGAQFGVRYDGSPQSGVDLFSWTLCATLEFPMAGWPASDTGTLLTWDSNTQCQKGEVGVAGYFYCGAYSTDAFWLTERPVDGSMKVADCQAHEVNLDAPTAGGMVRFTMDGQSSGCNPCVYYCFQSPVERTTWSRLKAGAN